MTNLLARSLGVAVLLSGALVASAAAQDMHFLVGSSPGSGWDQTARAAGEALSKSGLADEVSFENLPGGAGAKAVSRLKETAERQQNTLMVSSTPVIIYGLQGALSYSWTELTPIASIIGDFAALAVTSDSEFESFEQIAAALEADPRALTIGGGSVIGSMDHLVAALAFKEAGVDATKVNYVPYEGGGAAMAALLSGEIDVLSTGLGEVLEQQRQGQIRILASTAGQEVGGVPTLKDQGFDVEFVNWRGFFGPPELPAETAAAHATALKEMQGTEAWAEIRERNGWVDIYNAGEDFTAFLQAQEDEVRALMNELGIQTKN